MKRIVFVICILLAIVQQNIKAEGNPFVLKTTANTHFMFISQEFTGKDSIMLSLDYRLEGLALNGYVIQTESNSFVRVLLEDKDGKHHLVLESSRLYHDVDTFLLHDYCEETIRLHDISPFKLKIFTRNATLNLTSLKINETREQGNTLMTRDGGDEYLQQLLDKISAINSFNATHNGLWLADLTDFSMLSMEEKWDILGLSYESDTQGFEFYAGGIFDFEGSFATGIENNRMQSSITSSSYIESFDWRNRHGKNWITSVKNQGTGYYGWAFAAIGAVEAMANLYFNKKIDMDLSEQEIISNVTGNFTYQFGSGFGDDALKWVKQHGVSEELSFPFANAVVPAMQQGPYSELVKINNYVNVSSSDNAIKSALIEHGPLVSGMDYDVGWSGGHDMLLVGYGTVHVGDTISCYGCINGYQNFVVESNNPYVGKTYWIFKNSFGAQNSNNQGYVKAIKKYENGLLTPYYIVPSLISLQYSEAERVWEDADGDGYYNWGIGTKPVNCPLWVPDLPDGDDSDPTKGPMDEYGYCGTIENDLYANYVKITTSVSWNPSLYNGRNLAICRNGHLTISTNLTFGNTILLVKAGGSLTLNGAHLTNVSLLLEPGATLNMNNGGSIDMNNSYNFSIPQGTLLNLNYGAIY